MPKFVGNRFGPNIKVLPNQKVGGAIYNFEDVYLIQNSNSWPNLGTIAYFTIVTGPYDEQGLVINLNDQPNYSYRFQHNQTYVIRFSEVFSCNWDLTGGGGRGGYGQPSPTPNIGQSGGPVYLRYGPPSSEVWRLTAGGGTGGSGGPFNGTWGGNGQQGVAGQTSQSGTYPPIGLITPYNGNYGTGGTGTGTPQGASYSAGNPAPSRYSLGVIPSTYNGYAAGGSGVYGAGGGGGGGAYWKIDDHQTTVDVDYTIVTGANSAAVIRIDTPT